MYAYFCFREINHGRSLHGPIILKYYSIGPYMYIHTYILILEWRDKYIHTCTGEINHVQKKIHKDSFEIKFVFAKSIMMISQYIHMYLYWRVEYRYIEVCHRV
jgi:hypothetical protein